MNGAIELPAMSTQETSGEPKANVRIGRSMRLTTAVAMGTVVTVGLTVYLFLGSIFEETGVEAPTSYLLTLFFFLPIVLAVAERASATPGPGGLFNLSRTSGSVRLAFTTGWLLLGGLFGLAALFAWEGGIAVSQFISAFFFIQIEPTWLAALLVFLVLLFTQSRTMAIWKRRSTYVYLSIVILAFLMISAWFAPVDIPTSWIYLPSIRLLSTISFIAVSLWSIHFVLDRRDAMPRPRRQILVALYLPIVIGALTGAAAVATLLLYPSLTYLKPLPLITLAQQIHPLLVLLVILAMFIIGVIGTREAFASLLRLSGALAGDGILPEQFLLRRHIWKRPFYMKLAFITITTILVLFVPPDWLVSLTAAAVLFAIILVNVQDLFRSKPKMPANRFPRLPLHPLVPGISVAIAITMLVTEGLEVLFVISIWAVPGFLIYVFFARDGAIKVRRRDAMVAGAMMPAKKTSYRVMVAISDPTKAESLIRLGAKIAAAHNGLLVILRVALSTNDDESDQLLATNEWNSLYDLLTSPQEIGIPAAPLVRIAPDAAEGILTTVWEEEIDLVLLGWPDKSAEEVGQRDGAIGKIVHKAQCEVVVLHGSWPNAVNRVLVPVVSAGHSVAALSLGQDLVEGEDTDHQVTALRITRGKLSAENRQQAEKQLQKTRSKLDAPQNIKGEITAASSTRAGILNASTGYDALLLGLSNEGFLTQTDFSGLPVDIALNTSLPTLLVKRHEMLLSYWLRRSWDQLSEVLPKLSPKRRAVVGADMRHDARADIDFYVLMVLAASIALFGLLQNSAAVIIGAMLVAPLMSPILAMSHSIVRGQTKILRRATESTLNGVVLAITVGALVSLLLVSIGIPIPPTNEILARTQPNILDLLVALASGAAAAYAISRSEVSAALPGVAIAAALVPPLSVVGYGLGTAQFDFAAGSLMLFLTNLAAIILAAAVVFLLLGIRPPVRDDSDEQARFGLKMAIVALILIAIPLFATTRVSANQAALTKTVLLITDQYWPPDQADVTEVVLIQERNDDLVVSCTIYDYAGVVTDQSVANLQVTLSSSLGEPVILNARIIEAGLSSYDDSSAVRQLTQTPTPTRPGLQEMTLPDSGYTAPGSDSTPALLPNSTPVPPISETMPPLEAETQTPEGSVSPSPAAMETTTAFPTEPQKITGTPIQSPSPVATAEP